MKTKNSHACIILVFSLFFGLVSTQKTNAQNIIINEQIDSLLSNLYASGDFNGTALVVKQGNTIYEKSFGYSTGIDKVSLKTSDKFGIGSIYKELPAIAIMQLQEKGFLKIEDKISKHIPDLPEWANTISIKNLFQYTSGLPKVNWMAHKVISDSTLLKDLKAINELQFLPNEAYLYSNNNPFLLSLIVENISGEKFNDYIDNKILKPFGLKQSVFKKTFPYENRIGMAIPFDDEYVEDFIPFKISSPVLLFTTSAYDLYKLNNELHKFRIINEASLRTISEVSSLDFDNLQSPLGNVKTENEHIIKHSHHGSSGNYECLIQKDVKTDVTIVIFTNSKRSNVYEISEAISKIVF